MNKLSLKIFAGIAFVLLLTFNLTTIQNNTSLTLGGSEAMAAGNIVTCYSTMMVEGDGCWFWQKCWSRYDCGSCQQIHNVNAVQDPGTCEHIPGPGVN